MRSFEEMFEEANETLWVGKLALEKAITLLIAEQGDIDPLDIANVLIDILMDLEGGYSDGYLDMDTHWQYAMENRRNQAERHCRIGSVKEKPFKVSDDVMALISQLRDDEALH